MEKIKSIGLVVLCSFAFSCAQNRPQFSGKTEAERLNKFFTWSFSEFIGEMPQQMAYLGIPKKQDQLNDFSPAFSEKMHGMQKAHLKILRSFDRSQLTGQDRLSYDLYEKNSMQSIADYKWRDYRYSVNQMFGVQSGLPNFMMNIHRITSEKDARNYIARLSQFNRVFAEVTNSLMRSELAGVMPPQFVFPMVIRDSKNIISGAPFDKSGKDSPLLQDFKTKISSLKIDKAKKDSLTNESIAQLRKSVQPAYENLISFLEQQKERASKDDGVWKFPNGGEYYKNRLNRMTTTQYSPEFIHNMGLENVKRIQREMNKIRKQVNFKGDLKAFFKYTQGQKFLFPDNKKGKQAYLKIAKKYIGDMRKDLDRFFITKPKADIVVKPVEAFREKSAGLAFYQSPSLDGTRPGTYYVNLDDMKSLPKWEAEALAYHEGIPGHHMQLTIAQELANLPKFRKFARYTSYTEGWGLYSERLPKEYGYYKDPYSDFGRLSMELTRATRLVVDTGIHWKKWTREQAIAYLDKNTPNNHDENVKAINRYIVMPGQATAYMVGMLKILEVRAKARKQMGKNFDIRKFHEVILTSGPVPLDVMEKLVEDYIKTS